jgi:phage head maturation protease
MVVCITFTQGCATTQDVVEQYKCNKCNSCDNFKPFYIKARAITLRPDIPGLIISREAINKCYKSLNDRNILLGHNSTLTPKNIVGRILNVSIKNSKKLNCDYIEIIARITDKDTIKRIKRGDYYYMSIGLRGVEGVKNPLTGTLFIKSFVAVEVSFVCVPRDKFAKVLEYSYNINDLREREKK